MKQVKTNRFTDAEMTIAKETDLPDLLSHLGYSVRRIGSYYTTREMDSIRIKNRRSWRRYSTSQHGDAITFLQEFCGKSFQEAVEFLLDFHGRARDPPAAQRPRPPPAKEEQPVFALPPAHTDQRRVFAYLQKRGIASQVIRSFISAGLLYEDTPYHNCVFVGRNRTGQPVSASKRGTCDWNGSGFKGGVPGSNKLAGFPLPCSSGLDWVTVFEAPIDLMSFFTLYPEVRSNAIALNCLYEGPLDTCLKENPHLRRIVLCLDADGPGREAAERMIEKYTAEGYSVSYIIPVQGKDWNEYLQIVKENPEKIQRGGHYLVANLGQIISDKTAADAQRREQRQAERENVAAMRDACVGEITSTPEVYARFLNMQGDNPGYGAGSIALVMAQDAEATVFGTPERWEAQSRAVLDTERDNGMKIFTKSQSGRFYVLADVYDIRQTQGRELKSHQLQDDTPEMAAALAALLDRSPVPVTADAELPAAARYDQQRMELTVNPEVPDSEAFAAIAAEVAHARFHDRGFNTYYDRESQDLAAQSVSCILCRRFGVQREPPDLSGLADAYREQSIQSRRQSLDGIQSTSRQIGNAIEKRLAPPQRSSPSRHDHER